MMLADAKFRVALVTSHLPLRLVPDAITKHKIISVAQTVYCSLKVDFQIKHPRIALAGLNPHAGEQGILGGEEQEIIIPAINELKDMGIDILGPLPADTMFIDKTYDAYIAMYHDQGLSVLKYATFGKAANISLGLPIIRTSVDHGTAFHLAGTGQASAKSLLTAIKIAKEIQKNRRGAS
jgi:4-hydroxythreonine-4-phosphate dehydrogenase